MFGELKAKLTEDVYCILMPTKQTIRIYIGQGAGEESVAQAKFSLEEYFTPRGIGVGTITTEELLSSPWEGETLLLVMPGGRDIPYCEALHGRGCTRIRAFLEQGGRYLGLCAGAYFAASYCEFDRGMPLEVCGKRELGLFEGRAIGPAYGPGTYVYGSERGARISTLEWKGKTTSLYTYFNGGCFFDEPVTSEVMARFKDLPDSPPAIVRARIGHGVAVLSGVHPEFNPKRIDHSLSCARERASRAEPIATHPL